MLCALDRTRESNRTEARRHKTPIQLARQLVTVLIHRFPERKFILVGDGGYASQELAHFCVRHRRRVALVSRFHPDANLYDLPPANRSAQGGRPRLKGRKRAAPGMVVRNAKRKRCAASWYGGQSRRVELVSASGRRSIEVAFQEVRTHPGLTTPRNWSKKSVLRTDPCLFGLLSVVTLIFAHRTGRHRITPSSAPWYARRAATFSDAITAVGRPCWGTVLKGSPIHAVVAKLPRRFRPTLLEHLSRAA